jgi:hypothetical protein
VTDSSRAGRVVLAICALTLFGATIRIALHDPADEVLAGDQASFVYNAISLRGGDLSYDEQDQAAWQALDWEPNPYGIFFQARGDGWAFAKPLGYSVLLAPPLAVFGLRGVSVLGAALVLAYAGCWYAAARLRWGRSPSAVVATTATVASNAWLYGFPAHADLFVAVLVGLVAYGCLRAARPGQHRWVLLAAPAAGLLLTEKVPALLALLPLLAVTLLRVPRRAAVAGTFVLLAVGLLSTLPYLYYSDGASWSAYGGERYYGGEEPPWAGGDRSSLTAMGTDEVITASFAWDRLTHPSSAIPSAAVSYVVGQRTGALTFLPVVPALVLATLVARPWRRRSSEVGLEDPGGEAAPIDRTLALSATIGLLSYAAFYLLLFTHNHYGGMRSIGSRYFLQISVLAVVVPVAGGLGARLATRCAAFAAVWAILVLGPNLLHADTAFADPSRVSWVQGLLPVDGTQVGYWHEPGR